MLLYYLAKRRNTKITFSLKCCISALPEFNHLFGFFNLIDSRLTLTMLHDSLNHLINVFSPQGCCGHGSGEKSQVCCRSWTVLHAQCTSALSSGFPIVQGNAEALKRWGGKTKHHLTSYFLSNTSAKNYRNWIVYVDYSKSKVKRFFETWCIKRYTTVTVCQTESRLRCVCPCA